MKDSDKKKNEIMVLSFDKDTYNKKVGTIGYFIINQLQPLINELIALKVELNKDLIFEFINSPYKLENLFKEKAKKDTEGLAPIFKNFAETEYMKMIQKAIKLAKEAESKISSSELPVLFFQDNIVFDDNFKGSVNDKYLDELREMCTERLDSKERIEVWEKANKVIQEIEDLANIISRNRKGNDFFDNIKQTGINTLAQEESILAITPSDVYDVGILHLKDDGSIEIRKEKIGKYIK